MFSSLLGVANLEQESTRSFKNLTIAGFDPIDGIKTEFRNFLMSTYNH